MQTKEAVLKEFYSIHAYMFYLAQIDKSGNVGYCAITIASATDWFRHWQGGHISALELLEELHADKEFINAITKDLNFYIALQPHKETRDYIAGLRQTVKAGNMAMPEAVKHARHYKETQWHAVKAMPALKAIRHRLKYFWGMLWQLGKEEFTDITKEYQKEDFKADSIKELIRLLDSTKPEWLFLDWQGMPKA